MQESTRGIAEAQRTGTGIESSIINAVQWLRLAVETTGASIVALGIVIAVWQFLSALARSSPDGFNTIRLTLARYLALALEFQLGADILSTAIAPSWEQIGKLGAIAVIRTGLNYFLMREMEMSRPSSDKGAKTNEQARKPAATEQPLDAEATRTRNAHATNSSDAEATDARDED